MRYVVDGVSPEVSFGQEDAAVRARDGAGIFGQRDPVTFAQDVQHATDEYIRSATCRAFRVQYGKLLQQSAARTGCRHISDGVGNVGQTGSLGAGTPDCVRRNVDPHRMREMPGQLPGEAAVAAPDVHNRQPGVQVLSQPVHIAAHFVVAAGIPEHVAGGSRGFDIGPEPVPGNMVVPRCACG
ncbi:hypothetical protein D9M72_534050 [compost metagenome]